MKGNKVLDELYLEYDRILRRGDPDEIKSHELLIDNYVLTQEEKERENGRTKQ